MSVLDKMRDNDEPMVAVDSSIKPNPAQLQAIKAPVSGAVRVLAPPGSGKTFVLEHRYTHLLNNGVRPDQIVAVTFTSKMAKELLNRISATNPSVRGTQGEKQITTIHAICFRILRNEGINRKVPFTWQIKKIINEISDKVYAGFNEKPTWSELYDWIAVPKNENLSPSEDTEFYQSVLGKHGLMLDSVREKFDAEMKKNKWFTFADMMYMTEQLFKFKPEVLKKYQERYTHIIVDEGQDTSAQAMRILTALATPQNNFFIVGDADQLLYRFAGATPEENLFEGFESRYPNGETILLKINYRSTQNIVNACRILIDNNYKSKSGPYEQKYRKEVESSPTAKLGDAISFEMYSDPNTESRGISEQIEILLEKNYEPGDIFVGARTAAQLGYLEGFLARKEIPYVNIAGRGFWASKHVADVVAYLRVAIDETDKESFKRIYNIASNEMVIPWGDNQGEYCTHRWLGKAFLEKCYGSYKYVWKAVKEKRSFKAGVEDMADFIRELQAIIHAEDTTPVDAIKFILDECYIKYMREEDGESNDDGLVGGKLLDFETVSGIAGNYTNMSDFLLEVAKAQKAAEAVKGDDLSKYVILSTVHRLKGLERKVVFGMGLSEGMGKRGTTETPAGLLPHTFSLTPPPQFGVLPAGKIGRVEDERCITYVLVSRAKELVYLSGLVQYRSSVFQPSRFIKELGI